MPRAAVFLDRDGVLNAAVVRDGKPYPPASAAEMRILQGVKEACDALKAVGYLLIVVTNQPDIARKKVKAGQVDEINRLLQENLAIDSIEVCPHDDADKCRCRKPQPGLLLDASKKWNIDLAASFMVGDRWRDIAAGASAGCKTVFIDNNYAEPRPADPDYVCGSLAEIAPILIEIATRHHARGEQGMTVSAERLQTKIFADGAEKAKMLELYQNPLVRGFTTNPTLMRQAGITNYEAFAKDILTTIKDRPISFEVFSDEFEDMERQAKKIATWGSNVYVKIPVTNTKGVSAAPLIRRLVDAGVQLNVTAIFTTAQIDETVVALKGTRHSYVSVFAGRIADAGSDPIPFIEHAVEACNVAGSLEVIWASPREILNIVQADAAGCHVITVTPDLLKKVSTIGKDLDTYSLETVKMFYNDGKAAGFTL